MHVTFSGAAREVTGSCHLVTVGDHTIALDCGLFQGRRAESREKNVRMEVIYDLPARARAGEIPAVPGAQDAFAAELRRRGYTVTIPAPGDQVRF